MARLGSLWNVLVVDDDPGIVDIISAFLRTSGDFSYIIAAKDGAEAINKFSNQEFDLVIIDVMLPKKTGFEAISIMKLNPKYRNAKFIMISGAVRSEDVVRAAMYEIKHFLVKPFSRQKLIDTVHKVMGPRKRGA